MQRSEVAPATEAITATDTDRLPTNGKLTLKQNLQWLKAGGSSVQVHHKWRSSVFIISVGNPAMLSQLLGALLPAPPGARKHGRHSLQLLQAC